MEHFYSLAADLYIPLLLLPALIAAEVLTVGYKNSSLFSILHPQKTEWWDIFSWATAASGLRGPAANVCLFGLYALLKQSLPESMESHLSLGLLQQGNYFVCFALAFLMRDFLLYIRHRIRHMNAWFWNFHEFHHSAQRVGLFTANRVHFIDSVTYFFMVILPIQFIFGIEMRESILFEAAGWLFGLLNHSRLDTGFGWVGKYILMSPRDHHLHHEKDSRQHKNFGECFVFWDKLFGTYERAETSIFQMNPGITGDFYHQKNFLYGIFLPVLRIYTIPLTALARLRTKM